MHTHRTPLLLSLLLLGGCAADPLATEVDRAPAGGRDTGAGGRDTGRGDGPDTGEGAGSGDGLDATGGGDDADARSEIDADTLGDASLDSAVDDDATVRPTDTAPDLAPPDVSGDASIDDAGAWTPDGGGTVDPALCPASSVVPALCLAPIADESADRQCDGFDNDCDGTIDEGCPCKQGEVQPCFAGPPGRVGTGACAAGTQLCVVAGDTPQWGACDHAVSPSAEVCDGLDNDCNGCTDELFGCSGDLLCPGPGDPRTPPGRPFAAYPMHGADFYALPATAWSWTIEGGPCDGVLPTPSFSLTGARTADPVFTPLLSGSYTVTMRVTGADGGVFECTWVVHVEGPGVRIEMCYPESTTQDLDLYLMGPGRSVPWYPTVFDAFSPSEEACSWYNCEAHLRGARGRCDWGYGTSPLENCVGGPLGSEWRSVGYCANPRLDIDNNLSEGVGLPENINVDAPRDGDNFRIMVENFTGTIARPIVNVYCGGALTASFGVAPDTVPGFAGRSTALGVGAMWRVADVVAHVDAAGVTTGCTVTAIHPPGSTSGYHVTQADPSF